MNGNPMMADHLKPDERVIVEMGGGYRGRSYSEGKVVKINTKGRRRTISVLVDGQTRLFSEEGRLNNNYGTYSFLRVPTPELEDRLKRGRLLAATEVRLHQLSALLGLNELSILDMEDFLEKTASLIPGDGR